MPFLSPNQQLQSTEGWQSSWLWASMLPWSIVYTAMAALPLASRQHHSCEDDSVPGYETARCQPVIKLSRWPRNTVVPGIFTVWIPFLSPKRWMLVRHHDWQNSVPWKVRSQEHSRDLFRGGSGDDEPILICVVIFQQPMKLLKPLNHVCLTNIQQYN